MDFLNLTLINKPGDLAGYGLKNKKYLLLILKYDYTFLKFNLVTHKNLTQ